MTKNSLTVAHVGLSNQTYRKFHRRWVQGLRDAGDHVTWFSEDWGDAPVLEADGVPFVEIPVARNPDPAKVWRSYQELRSQLRRRAPDVVVTEGTLPSIVARVAAPPQTRRLHIVHSFPWHDLTNPVVRRLEVLGERVMSRWTHHRILISKEDFAEGIRRRITTSDRATYSPVGIDPDLYGTLPSVERIREVRRELGLDSAQRVVLFVGRIVEYKGPFDVARAFAGIQQEFPHHVLAIVGRPDPRPGAVADSHRLGTVLERTLGGRYRWLPFARDMPALYAASDLFVMPSLYEGLGLVYLEAGAMGVPCIGYDVRGVREGIVHGTTGLLVPPRQVPELADAMRDLLQSEERRRAMGRAGQTRWRRGFSNADFADVMVKTVHALKDQ